MFVRSTASLVSLALASVSVLMIAGYTMRIKNLKENFQSKIRVKPILLLILMIMVPKLRPS